MAQGISVHCSMEGLEERLHPWQQKPVAAKEEIEKEGSKASRDQNL